MSQTLKISFSGNGISPDKVSANEFAKLVIAYENALLAVVNKNHPGRKGLSRISIVKVIDESLTILAEPNSEDVIEAADIINTSISTNKLFQLPFEAVDNLSVIQAFVEKYGCDANLNGIEGIASAKITPATDLRITKSFYIKGETTIYGTVLRIGGAEPRIRVQADNGTAFSVVTNASTAKELTSHLYERIGVKGLATWKKENNELIEIKLKSFVLLSKLPLTERLKGLQNLLGEFWTDVDNPDDFITSLRG